MDGVKLKKYFYQSPTGGFMYDTPAEAAEALMQRPDEIPHYIQSMYQLSKNLASWRDLEGMRACLNLVVDVLVEIEKQNAPK